MRFHMKRLHRGTDNGTCKDRKKTTSACTSLLPSVTCTTTHNPPRGTKKNNKKQTNVFSSFFPECIYLLKYLYSCSRSESQMFFFSLSLLTFLSSLAKMRRSRPRLVNVVYNPFSLEQECGSCLPYREMRQ